MARVKKAPLPLLVVAGALILSPLYYYLMEARLAGLPLGRVGAVVGHFSVPKLVGILLAPLVGVALLRVARWSWILTVVYAAYTVGFNAWAYSRSTAVGWKALLFSMTGAALVLYLVRREVRAPYFDPNITRWVRDRERWSLRVEVKGQADLVCETFDISPSGCFLVTDRAFDAGARLELFLHLPEGRVEAAGMVVWVSDGAHKPRGIGIRFEDKRAGKAAVQQIRRRRATTAGEPPEAAEPPKPPSSDAQNVA